MPVMLKRRAIPLLLGSNIVPTFRDISKHTDDGESPRWLQKTHLLTVKAFNRCDPTQSIRNVPVHHRSSVPAADMGLGQDLIRHDLRIMTTRSVSWTVGHMEREIDLTTAAVPFEQPGFA